ncbi:uncharacterized protein LAJ45_07965 [Morchella importuna]|uniref:uncharacterized protein n=1 Tax=Morchella importuna TaxID=1174673 RepID=UPI001E8D8A06|nr:uncharacterized protein LAJ45_07965 [Morchella importuna]KAH8147864.1 hypothetical protein LAJ45_07965 [Morchella importuna]
MDNDYGDAHDADLAAALEAAERAQARPTAAPAPPAPPQRPAPAVANPPYSSPYRRSYDPLGPQSSSTLDRKETQSSHT